MMQVHPISHFKTSPSPELYPPYTVPLVHAGGHWCLCACKSLHKILAAFLRALFLKCRLVSWLWASVWAAQPPLHTSCVLTTHRYSQVLLLHCCPGPLLWPSSAGPGCLLSCLVLLALLLLYFVRASREIVSCQLSLGWWKAWSWETTQHLNLCLFWCLIVNLVYKVNGSGEMGFLSLKRM